MDDRLAEEWRVNGYVVLRGVLDIALAARLRRICDGVLEQWRRRDPQTGAASDPDATVMRHLNHPDYFVGGAPGLGDVLELAAHPKLLALARTLLGEEPMFRCTSYFMNPLENSLDGEWHRDSQYETSDEASERKLVLSGGDTGAGVQLQVALAPSDDVEIVRGSHLSYDTPEEYAIRRARGRPQQPLESDARRHEGRARFGRRRRLQLARGAPRPLPHRQAPKNGDADVHQELEAVVATTSRFSRGF